MKRASIRLLVLAILLAATLPLAAAPAAPARTPAALTPPLAASLAVPDGSQALAAALSTGGTCAAAPQAAPVRALCFQCPPPLHQCLVNNRCSCCLSL